MTTDTHFNGRVKPTGSFASQKRAMNQANPLDYRTRSSPPERPRKPPELKNPHNPPSIQPSLTAGCGYSELSTTPPHLWVPIVRAFAPGQAPGTVASGSQPETVTPGAIPRLMELSNSVVAASSSTKIPHHDPEGATRVAEALQRFLSANRTSCAPGQSPRPAQTAVTVGPEIVRVETHREAMELQRLIHSCGSLQDIPDGRIEHFMRRANKPARRAQHPGDTRAMQRRRRLADIITPPAPVSEAFTRGELAVFTAVAIVQTVYGACDWATARLAAIAGVGHTTAYNALRKLRLMELSETTWRDSTGRQFSDWRNAHFGADNLSNIVRLVGVAGTWLVRWKKALKNLSSILRTRAQTFSLETCVSPP